MGNLGLLFEVENKDLVIFTKSSKVKGDLIIGVKNFKQNKTKYKFLSKDLSIQNFIVLENSNFKYSKISLNDKKVIDYDYLSFWFGTKDYKLLRDLFEVRDNDQKLLVRKVLDILKYFN